MAMVSSRTHEELLAPVSEAFIKADHDQARKSLLRRHNPDWYPRPVKQTVDADGARGWESQPPGTFLSEEQWGRAYGLTAPVSCTQPLRHPDRDLSRSTERAGRPIAWLVEERQYLLVIPGQEMYVGQVQNNGFVRVTYWEPF